MRMLIRFVSPLVGAFLISCATPTIGKALDNGRDRVPKLVSFELAVNGALLANDPLSRVEASEEMANAAARLSGPDLTNVPEALVGLISTLLQDENVAVVEDTATTIALLGRAAESALPALRVALERVKAKESSSEAPMTFDVGEWAGAEKMIEYALERVQLRKSRPLR